MTLQDYLKEAALSRAAFARQLGVSQETVRRYLAGTRIPDRQIMERIALQTGSRVTANDFFGMVQA